MSEEAHFSHLCLCKVVSTTQFDVVRRHFEITVLKYAVVCWLTFLKKLMWYQMGFGPHNSIKVIIFQVLPKRFFVKLHL